jgi:hypothetical protein
MITKGWFRLIILSIILIVILCVYNFKETFTASYPVYGSSWCQSECNELEAGYSFEKLCRCKKCCEDYPECSSAFSRLLDYYDWGDGKDCNFDE